MIEENTIVPIEDVVVRVVDGPLRYETGNRDMIDNHQVIAWTPYGRQVTVSILIEYMRRDHEAGVIDEYWLYSNVGKKSDLPYMHELAEAYDWVKIIERPDDCEYMTPIQRNTGYAYRHMTDPNSVFVRFDDDIGQASQVDRQPVRRNRETGDVVPAAFHAEQDAVLARPPHRGGDARSRGRLDDGSRKRRRHPVPDQDGVVPPLVARAQKRAVDACGQLVERGRREADAPTVERSKLHRRRDHPRLPLSLPWSPRHGRTDGRVAHRANHPMWRATAVGNSTHLGSDCSPGRGSTPRALVGRPRGLYGRGPPRGGGGAGGGSRLSALAFQPRKGAPMRQGIVLALVLVLSGAALLTRTARRRSA